MSWRGVTLMIDKIDINNKAISIRKKLGEDPSSPIDIFLLAQTIPDMTLVFYPLGENISGACLKGNSSALIVINSDMSLGRQRFSLAHELYHYYFDTDSSSIVCSKEIGAGTINEKKADQFASYFLMPPAALYELIKSFKDGQDRKLTIKEVVKIEQYFGVSRQAMLFRLEDIRELEPNESTEYRQGIIKTAARLGFDVSLYKPSPENKKKLVLGHYVSQAENLLEKEIISQGKYEELMLDAFRYDIVYGEGGEGGELID
jgi:Zn-dependent peptidase ImmA (M78 family)